MGLAPLLDALDIFLAAKVIPVGRFSQPAALTGGFAGATAVRSGTIGLMIGVAVFGSEELLAATAFATICLWTHDSDYGAGRKNLNRPRQRRKKEEGRKVFAKFPKKISRPRKWNFKPPEMPQFHSAADNHHPSVLDGLFVQLNLRFVYASTGVVQQNKMSVAIEFFGMNAILHQ